MNYLSVCSGIEAATVAWHPLGWNPVGFSEIESFPSQVLKHHYPTVPNLGDMTKFKEREIESNIDVFVGGTPCQSFSVAGLRKGLDDPRGNLMLTYLAIAKQYRPRWLVWENVPGVLSSADGRDFGSFLGGLAVCGYGFAYRVLDAQYFGVAQRRKRVFVVGYLGDWRPAAAVLFERESLSGYPAPRREKRQEVAGTIATRFGISRNNHEECMTQRVYENHPADSRVKELDQVCSTVTSRWGTGGGNAPMVSQETVGTLCADSHPGAYSGQDAYTGRLVAQPVSAYSIREDAKANTFSATKLEVSVALKALQPSTQSHHAQTFVAQTVGTDCYNGSITGDIACTMGTSGSSVNASGPTVMQSMAVRRLTVIECERLQGFPDHYTDIKPKGKPTADGPRYKALGNSMAVPVMNWIGQKIQKVEDLIK
jgi:DNA (cytosine-5)-methyltransferase 1